MKEATNWGDIYPFPPGLLIEKGYAVVMVMVMVVVIMVKNITITKPHGKAGHVHYPIPILIT